MTESTLADDEASLEHYASTLARAIDSVALPWLCGLVEQHMPGLTERGDVREQLEDVAADVVRRVQMLLEADIAEQRSGPLELLRAAIATPTQILRAEAVPHVERDAFAVRNFPDDVYNLSPASFAEVDPSLQEPGLIWGAAKAHVHLRRRRQADESTEPAVVVVSGDLMDRSKISGAFPDATFVRSLAKAREAASEPGLVMVDLARVEDVAALAELPGRVVVFGSHVDDELLEAAQLAGVESMPRSVFFRRLSARQI